jgi:glycosyltransferase involved in cell wall biosynthesis
MVMVGPCEEVFHSYFGTVKRRVDELRIADRVVFTGFLADSELPVLLNLASVLVLPSLLEGYGLPAVEAAACGLPVIATTASPLPDLLAGGGLFVDPLDGDGWRNALETLLRSPELRARMGKAGRAAAGQLTWDAAARQMFDVFRLVAA